MKFFWIFDYLRIFVQYKEFSTYSYKIENWPHFFEFFFYKCFFAFLADEIQFNGKRVPIVQLITLNPYFLSLCTDGFRNILLYSY